MYLVHFQLAFKMFVADSNSDLYYPQHTDPNTVPALNRYEMNSCQIEMA